MAQSGFLEEGNITIPMLCDVFRRAFYRTSLDDDGDIRVQTNGPLILVSIDTNKHLIKFMTIYGLKAGPLQSKIAFANRMNAAFILARFFIPSQNEELIIADYFIPFDAGLAEFSIISSVRMFEKIVISGISNYDTDNLVD
jgi:hypothetical protein